jgi:hypothetical protein
MDDPDWVVPHYARILKTNPANNKTTESVLEAVIENLSKSTLPISELTITAEGREGAKCATTDENSWAPPPENLVLNWPRLIESQKTDASNQAAWVKLGTFAVPIKARFLEKGCRNPRLFQADIPVNLNIPPAGAGRIKLSVTEMTQLSKSHRGLIPRDPIAALPDWPFVTISVKPSERIFPKSIDVVH